MSFRVGVDVGGTFTDLFLWSSEGGVATAKTLSTPADPSEGVLDGLSRLAEEQGESLESFAGKIQTIVHGTTVTTNALLTRSGASMGLLTTEGVRDALEMRRGIREEQYNNRFPNVTPLVPRYLRRPVRGRLDYSGEELDPLELEDLRDALRRFAAEGVEAVAICFMNAYADPAHERAAAELVRSEMPDAFLGVSSEVLPTVRFYNRLSTTVLNCYVGPILRKYLDSLTRKLAALGFGGVLLIMQSNGGVALPEVTLERPAATLLSGPAGAPAAAGAYARHHGREDCIVVDMGGTSFDASLVRDGEAAMVNESDIDRLRIALPMLAITTIGAGGGSIGSIDDGGMLRMGPASAGADPGPACYGRGGELPTCTDANVVLGYLDPAYFAGGRMPLDRERAERAITRHVATPLGLSLEEAAAGMYRLINSTMAHGVREITVERGLDPREFPLVVAGGAGPLHACMIARELEIPTLLVPGTASVLCATGMLLCDLRHDFVRSYVCRFQDLDHSRLAELVDEMIDAGERQLRLEGIPAEDAESQIALDVRYVKQYHEVTVPVPPAAISGGDLGVIPDIFHAEHDRLYGYELSVEGTELELINVRVRVLGRTERPVLPRIADHQGAVEPSPKGLRRAFVPEQNRFAEVPVHDGHGLRDGHTLEGPVLIERTDTTIFASESYRVEVDGHGSCFLSHKGGPS